VDLVILRLILSLATAQIRLISSFPKTIMGYGIALLTRTSNAGIGCCVDLDGE
jgi:hypothetical protein